MYRFCDECSKETSYFVNRDGFNCCMECGLVDNHYIHLVSDFPSYDKEEEAVKSNTGGGRSSGLWSNKWKRIFTTGLSSSKGRYKPVFHWNERIAQICLIDPRYLINRWRGYGLRCSMEHMAPLKILPEPM